MGKAKRERDESAGRERAQPSDQAVEQHDTHGFALGDVAFIVAEHDETVGLAHRTQHARALRACRCDLPLAVCTVSTVHSLRGDAALKLIEVFPLELAKLSPVAGYWPVGGEIDGRPLLAALAKAGRMVALPRMAFPVAPLFSPSSASAAVVPPS